MLPDFDTLLTYSDNAKVALLEAEAEKVINSAPEHSRERLQALWWNIRTRADMAPNKYQRMIAAQTAMLNSLGDLHRGLLGEVYKLKNKLNVHYVKPQYEDDTTL